MIGQKVFHRKFPLSRVSYLPRDAILYALGIGIGLDQGAVGDESEALRFLYEENLAVMPTFANVLGPQLFWTGEDEFGTDWKRLLHVEQRLVLHQPLPPAGEVTVLSKVTGIRDKGPGRGALVFQEKQVRNAISGQALCSIEMTLLLRGDGGCGDFGQSPEALPELPGRQPDARMEFHAAAVLPFLYRLSGDFNPLHVDPEIARQAGFERPVIHGLCTMGMICRTLVKHYCACEPDRMRGLSLRFSQPVYPGDHLLLDCWDEGGGRVRFQANSLAGRRSGENGARVIDRGLALIR